MSVQIIIGDCRNLLRDLTDGSIDACVTDPPYELGFMGKKWDCTGIAYDATFWAEVLRVLKPGAHLLAFGGTRTHHRVWCAIEDVGFEVRDTLGWLYGSGFPKSHNGEWGGTALKPAWEPIILARKPLIGTVEANWREHGTGALNIKACRISTDEVLRVGAGATFDAMHKHEGRNGELSANRRYDKEGGTDFAMTPGPRGGDAAGRWPANILHDGGDEVLAMFPQTASGTGAIKRESSADLQGNTGSGLGKESRPAGTPMICHGDEGSAARFFYCAKPSRAEREVGLQGAKRKVKNWSSGTQNPGSFQSPNTDRTSTNHHPTVKPVDLVRLVTPKGGTVLDPFLGSGTTARACIAEGFDCIGMEKEAEYVEIAKARCFGDTPLFAEVAA